MVTKDSIDRANFRFDNEKQDDEGDYEEEEEKRGADIYFDSLENQEEDSVI